MTREETISILEESKRQNEVMRDNPSTFWASHQMADGVKNAERRIAALDMAIAALRPVSREQVEKVWRGEWIWNTSGLYPKPVCSKCGEEPYRRSNHTSDLPNYCPKCGRPMTDEAVEMVMERWKEAVDGEAKTD